MAAALAIVLIIVIALAVLLALGVRSLLRTEQQTEARLHSPGTHVVAWVVPEGQDPVAVKVALSRAGFTAVADTDQGGEALLVECDEADRDRVRDVIGHVTRTGYDGTPLTAERVVFEDEH
jgi:hypothetical protein